MKICIKYFLKLILYANNIIITIAKNDTSPIKRLSKTLHQVNNGYLVAYTSFCNYLVNEGFLVKNPLSNLPKRKGNIRLPRSLTDFQIKELFSFLSICDEKDFISYRNLCIVYTFLYSGIRRGELVNIKFSDVNFDESYIRIQNGKGNKERLVPLVGNLDKILKKYNKLASIYGKRDYFFCSCHGKKLSRNDLDNILVKKILKGLTYKFTWHQLRHTFATHLVRQNFDIYNISQILGHSRIDTTKIYLSSDTLKLKKQLENIILYN